MKENPANALAITPEKKAAALAMIPSDQMERFAEETEAAREHVLKWIAILDPLVDASNRDARFAEIAELLEFSKGAIRTKYYAWTDGLNGKVSPIWEKLINRSKFPAPNGGLPGPFVEFWKGIQERHQRNDSGAQAHRSLLAQLDRWAAGDRVEFIPGYESAPECVSYCKRLRRKVPKGWTYRNLIRIKPREFNRVSNRQGPRAAATLLPSNYGTRVGLKILERIFFDDQHYDQKVRQADFADGQRGNAGRILRPLGFNAMDHLTGAFLDYSIILTRWDEREERKRELTQEMFVWQVISVLQKVGYRRDAIGTTLVFEHGSATGYGQRADMAGQSFDQALFAVTGQQVSVTRSGRFDQPFLAQALFRGAPGKGKQASGNPRFKAPLESVFHLVRTYSSALLGQVGSNQRLNGPEGDAKLDSYTRGVVKAIAEMPPAKRERAIQLAQYPYHSFHEFCELMRLVYSGINGRRDHNLEGWEQCGFRPQGFNVDLLGDGRDTFISREQFAALEPVKRMAIESVAEPADRVLSPGEAARAGVKAESKVIARLQESTIPLLIPPSDDWTYRLTVNRKGEFTIQDSLKFGPEKLIFVAELETRHGMIALRPGDEYRGYLNPFHPDRLILTDMAGRFVGACDRFQKSTWGRPDAMENQGRLNGYRKRIGARSERRAATVADDMAAMVENNDRLSSGDAVTPEEIAEDQAEQIRNREARKRERAAGRSSADDVFAYDEDLDGSLDE